MTSLAAIALVLAGFALPTPGAPPRTACDVVEQRSADSLVVPVQIENNHVYVSMCMGGRLLSFILDTGAGQSFLDLGIARELGIGTGSVFSARGAGQGTIAGAQLNNASGTIAGTGILQRIGAALDLSALPAREGRPMDGILGYDFIATRVVAIDYASSTLTLYDRSRFRYEGSGTSLPLTFVSNHPHVDAQVVLTDGDTLRGRFVIDVGSSASLALAKPFVDDNRLRSRVGPTLRRPGGTGVGGQTMAVYGRIAALTLGSVALQNVVVGLHGDSAGVFSDRGSWVGNIGGDILRRFRVYFDYGARRMVLEPNAIFRDPFETDMSGLGIVASGGEWKVDFVLSNAPAMEAGLASGDVILEVDGRAVDRRLLLDLRPRFRRAGERVSLTVRRDGQTKTITLVTRRLV